ncbi:MAG: T9SS type A sorting domain-containing protein, partial [bacterium]|nr:T9SS type A sorting domain-containing protein [bacterium]
NPFTKTAILSYILPKEAIVSIKVYDITGKVIKVLVDKKQPANRYTINWDSSELSSGVYFIHMRVGKFTKIHKVVKIRG